jgi:hypothetical protein
MAKIQKYTNMSRAAQEWGIQSDTMDQAMYQELCNQLPARLMLGTLLRIAIAMEKIAINTTKKRRTTRKK